MLRMASLGPHTHTHKHTPNRLLRGAVTLYCKYSEMSFSEDGVGNDKCFLNPKPTNYYKVGDT